MTIYERLRDRIDGSNDTDHIVYDNMDFDDLTEDVSFSYVNSWEEIQDFHRKVKTKGRYPATPCQNLQAYVNVDRSAWETTWGIRGQPVWHTCLPFGPSVSQLREMSSFVQTQTETLTGQLAQDAYDAFCTQIPPETSLGNFALELKDITELIPRLGRSLSETVTNLHLGLSFGALPFIGDLQVLGSIVQRTIARIDRIKALNGKVSRLRFRRNHIYGIPAIAPRLDFPYDISAHLARVTCSFTASARLYARLDRLEGLEGVARGLYASLGLNNPMGIIWNALPFSFILDWVFRFSNVLARHATNPYIGVWAVSDLNWSLRTTSQWDVAQIRWRNPFPLNEYYTHDLGNVFCRSYLRQVGLPSSVNYFTVPPTAGQAALMLSLMSGSAPR